MPKTEVSAEQHEPEEITFPHKEMLTERHNDEKLAITLLIAGAGLIAYHVW